MGPLEVPCCGQHSLLVVDEGYHGSIGTPLHIYYGHLCAGDINSQTFLDPQTLERYADGMSFEQPNAHQNIGSSPHGPFLCKEEPGQL